MDLLFDTNALVWSLDTPDRLSQQARAGIEDARNRVFVSVISPWEMAIKLALGKLTMPPDLATWLPTTLASYGFTVLPIDLPHVLTAERLPRHHRDPFDRLLIAQALVEGLVVVTGDSKFEPYGVPVIWC